MSDDTPWYRGPSLIAHLDTVEIDGASLHDQPFRFPVQWVNRPNLDFRGFAGQVASGSIRVGDGVRILPAAHQSRVARIVGYDGDFDRAVAGQSITLVLADEIDCSRGDVIAATESPPEVADQFETQLIWMASEPMLPGRPQDRDQAYRRHRRAAQIQGQRQHPGASRRQAA
jgi:bifunctional enzyme CysN/CysC